MGTRSGDIDASILEFLALKEGMTLAEIDMMLNKQSGLLGVSGLTGDMRELLEEEAENKDRRASLAIDMFCARARKYIGAYFAEMGGAAAVVFTGGIGENAPAVRERICSGLGSLGLHLDPSRNQRMRDGASGEISTDGLELLRAFVFSPQRRASHRTRHRARRARRPAALVKETLGSLRIHVLQRRSHDSLRPCAGYAGGSGRNDSLTSSRQTPPISVLVNPTLPQAVP